MTRLTKAEEQVMQVLWRLERAFVRDIIEELPDPRPAYNTVSTIVRILEEKGFVAHTAFGKSYQYYPVVHKDQYRKYYLDTLVKGYFGGSFDRLVSFFVRENNLSLAEFEKMLELVQQDLTNQEPDDE